MLIYPAIDLMGGDAVRLHRGEAESREKVGDPLELVERFAAAPLIHVVDLDGAFAGQVRQTQLIAQLAQRHPIQAGGGVRSLDDVSRLFDAGVKRAVLGTAAVQNPELLDAALQRYGAEAVVVAVDVKGGKVAVSGWVSTSDQSPGPFAASLAARGIRWVLCTAVHRDGTLEGPDLNVLDSLRAADPRLNVIASGGIGSLDDVRACRQMAAVIIGKALYAGRFTLDEALRC
ncbi:MAG TPA: 1-(5-phosphoribosyl)-5-[(5-phosphoribosylamino)methylideneamino] imidazole-4-carboxamide isomerase [Myxococcaceae bacterium]|nr:1-(5-phosphoribosyl)-5-[(5-phosphoribosylamino)methylideneamino] imidazole-4-carboxamide isomerase [Myxococcaceae bacterium]